MGNPEAHEIVRVISSYYVADHETDGLRLIAPGYYLAVRPPATSGAAVRYFGPFATRSAASWLHAAAMFIGAVPKASSVSLPSPDPIRLDRRRALPPLEAEPIAVPDALPPSVLDLHSRSRRGANIQRLLAQDIRPSA